MARSWHDWPLRIAALAAMSLATYRAATQAITIDEAVTYLRYVAGIYGENLWTPFPNNHLLNSLLIWISTQLLGTSEFTVRIPALLGAGIYIFVCYYLCRHITDRFSLQFPLFICLVFNPFIMDFMAAARGYGLASAFLMAAIAIPMWSQTGGPTLRRSCALASLALALSFTANFSFAIADLVVFAVIVTWALSSRGKGSALAILSLCTLPGLIVVLSLAAYPLSHWPPNELIIGAQSLGEMAKSLADSSLHRLDPRFADFKWYKIATRLTPYLLPALGILCIFQLATTWRATRRLTLALLAIPSVTLFLHWLAFRVFDLPLPKTRAGIFFLPLFTLAAGAIAALPARSIASRWLGIGTKAMLACLAAYFLLCLRTTYFEEYIWDADLKEVYAVLAELNHSRGIKTVEMNGLYQAPLDFYRRLSTTETFTDFSMMGDLPSQDKDAYVVLVPYRQMSFQGLRVIYQGKSTDVAIAVR